jgi:hypothetical protein
MHNDVIVVGAMDVIATEIAVKDANPVRVTVALAMVNAPLYSYPY